MVLESYVEAYFRRKVAEAGGVEIKLNGTGRRFWPDRLACTPALGLFLCELKRPQGGRLSKGQKEAHTQIRDSGGRVFVAWNREMVDDIFNASEI